jgi:hypothetical protein
MTLLTRYWITFTKTVPRLPPGVQHGCGVTAQSEEEALAMVRKLVFRGGSLPPIEAIMTDIDISQLDPGHVVPNMGFANRRGIWFPLGYDKSPHGT